MITLGRDRRRDRAAEAAGMRSSVDRDRDLRVVDRREADEPGLVERSAPDGPTVAVPVLPATLMPSSFAAVPVPSSTTLRHHLRRRSAAVVGFITWLYTAAVIVSQRLPVLVDDLGR